MLTLDYCQLIKNDEADENTKKEVLDEELAKHSPFAKVFDAEYCNQFQVDSETGEEDISYNGVWFKDVEKMFNNQIRYKKYNMLTANEIYDYFKWDLSAIGATSGYHGTRVGSDFIFDTGNREGIKFYLFPVYYHDEATGYLKKSYIFDLNLDPANSNILGFYPTVQRTVKEINEQA